MELRASSIPDPVLRRFLEAISLHPWGHELGNWGHQIQVNSSNLFVNTSPLTPPVRTLIQPVGLLADANTLVRHPADRGTWVWHPEKAPTETAVLRFRLRFTLDQATTPILHITADQRFQLRCDGQDVTFGPDRCDLTHWTVQSVALELCAGEHELEALVWYITEYSGSPPRIDPKSGQPVNVAVPPMAQITWQAGFLVYAEGVDAGLLDTGAAPWVVDDLTDAVGMIRPALPGVYQDIGPCFTFDLDRWQIRDGKPAKTVLIPFSENPHGVRRPGRCLYPADIPEQQRQPWSGGKIRAVRFNWEETPFLDAETRAPEIGGWQKLERFHNSYSVLGVGKEPLAICG